MCGIVGYIGNSLCAPILLDGLEKLEYRGYDSAGIAVLEAGKISVEKTKGRLSVLRDKTHNGQTLPGTIGIGHTRWATHGKPSDINSHPHVSENGKIAVVHNGIIENYRELKSYLEEKGFTFVSDTDTEIFAHLLSYYYKGDMIEAVFKMMRKVDGSYALGVLCEDMPDSFIAVKKDSPLIIGLGENENFIASDVPAILKHTKRVCYPDDYEIVVLQKDNVKVYNADREIVDLPIQTVEWDISAAEKGGYPHFMLKEIMEQPRALADTIYPRIGHNSDAEINMEISPSALQNADKIYIVACGSAYHAGVVGKYIMETMTRKSVEVDLASEFRYRAPIFTQNTLVIIISQSGETADSIAALREAKRHGAYTIAIVNAVGSTIAKESDSVLYTWAGPEIAVATTKAYSSQLAMLYMLSLYMAKIFGMLSASETESFASSIRALPKMAESILEDKTKIQQIAARFFGNKNIFFIGRNLDYAVAMEGSLKLKEISYIHSEAYAAGELKHGTISLIEDGTLVVAVVTSTRLADKMRSNIREAKARGAVVLAVAGEDIELDKEADYILRVPATHPLLQPSLAIIPLQLFAYYVASMKGYDIDKPRNLAKSVTVE